MKGIGLTRVCVMKCNSCEKRKHDKWVLNLGSMDRLLRSNSFVSSGSSIPLDIINEEDYSVEENDFTKFKKWCIPKVDTKSIYKISWIWFAFNIEFNVKTVEKTYSISKTHKKMLSF